MHVFPVSPTMPMKTQPKQMENKRATKDLFIVAHDLNKALQKNSKYESSNYLIFYRI